MQAYNPFREFEEFEKNFFKNNDLAEFKTDIKDTGKEFVLEADLPGFKKEDIKVNVEDNYMTITAERHSESEEKDKKGNYIRCERSYGSFSRTFDITGIKTEAIKATYNDGVLTLTMPKKEETAPASRAVTIEW